MPQIKPVMLLADIFARALTTLPFATLEEDGMRNLAGKIISGEKSEVIEALDCEIEIHHMADNYIKADVLVAFRDAYKKWVG